MNFEELVKSKIPEFTQGQKKIAELILLNLEESSYSTLAKISKAAGVSETTVIRFSYALGFESFSAMQNMLRQEILGITVNEKHNEDAEGESFYDILLNKEIEILERIKKNINKNDIELAVEKLSEADKVFSVGARSAYPSVLWFGTTVGKLRENVYSVDAFGSEFLSGVVDVDSSSVVVCIGLSRVSKFTYQFAEMARKKGAFVIAVTDTITSPLSTQADIVILAGSNRDETGFNTMSSVAAVLNILAVGIRRKNPKKAISRLKEYEHLSKDINLIFE